MSDSYQTRLADTGPYAVDPTEQYGASLSEVGAELQRWNLMPEAIGASLEAIDPNWVGNIYRWQHSTQLWYYTAPPGSRDETEVAPIQFRTILYTIGMPDEDLCDYLKRVAHPRQRYLDDSPECNHWISGFGPFDSMDPPNTEGPELVGIDELRQQHIARLCVPIYQTEIYDENENLRQRAAGYIRPFTLIRHETPDPPQHVRWNIRPNTTSRGSGEAYELAPIGDEATRLAGLQKLVFLDDNYIGQLQAPRDRGVYFRVEYARAPTENGFTKWDRQRFIDEGIFHPNAIARGGAVWKVGETEDTISLRSTKPSEFDPDEIETDATGADVTELALVDDNPTTFDVREDEICQGITPPETREITREMNREDYIFA